MSQNLRNPAITLQANAGIPHPVLLLPACSPKNNWNRIARNAQKSCGPRSAEGKRISSQNSFKTGLYSQALVTLGEKLGDFETLRDEYYTHHSPQTPEERETLDIGIRLAWQLRRYAMVETHSWNLEVKAAELHVLAEMLEGNLFGSAFFHSDQRFARLHRMQAANQRNLCGEISPGNGERT